MAVAIDQAKLDHWFADHERFPEQTILYDTIRTAGQQFAQAILDHTPPCADQSDAIRKVREACFMAFAAIACGGR